MSNSMFLPVNKKNCVIYVVIYAVLNKMQKRKFKHCKSKLQLGLPLVKRLISCSRKLMMS